MDGLLSRSRVLNSSIFGAGGKNPMEDWNNETLTYQNVQVFPDRVSLVGTVTGSGWIISLGTTSTPEDIALHVDGSPFLGDYFSDEVVEVNLGVLLMKRYESSFDYYSQTADSNIVVYLEGDDYEQGTLKVLTDAVAKTATTTVINVTGEGWFYGGYSRGNGTTLTIDGTDVISDQPTRIITALVKFSSSLLVKNEAGTRVFFPYTLI